MSHCCVKVSSATLAQILRLAAGKRFHCIYII
jgi:hypothetical protein